MTAFLVSGNVTDPVYVTCQEELNSFLFAFLNESSKVLSRDFKTPLTVIPNLQMRNQGLESMKYTSRWAFKGEGKAARSRQHFERLRQADHEVRRWRPSWPTWRNPISTKIQKISQVWCTPIVPATQEAEAGESLEPGRQRLQSSVEIARLTKKKKKKKGKNRNGRQKIEWWLPEAGKKGYEELVLVFKGCGHDGVLLCCPELEWNRVILAQCNLHHRIQTILLPQPPEFQVLLLEVSFGNVHLQNSAFSIFLNLLTEPAREVSAASERPSAHPKHHMAGKSLAAACSHSLKGKALGHCIHDHCNPTSQGENTRNTGESRGLDLDMST
ncbi:hypothetical protein AAY473_035228 [Plecturocebus cupreus]